MVINYVSDDATGVASLLNRNGVDIIVGDEILDLCESDEGVSEAVACAGEAFLEELGALDERLNRKKVIDTFRNFFEAACRRRETIMSIKRTIDPEVLGYFPAWGDIADYDGELAEFALDCLRDVM